MWVELVSGGFINLAMIEAVVPDPAPDHWRFFHPRSQRGGRPYGRPPDRPTYHNDDGGYWRGQPCNEPAMLAYLRTRETYDGPTPDPREQPRAAS
jgi:hypothetical protein